MERRDIRVILFSDVVQSSGLMFEDEASAVSMINHDLSLFARNITLFKGTLVKNTGDGILATFDTTLDALNFLRTSLGDIKKNKGMSLRHRFGLHIGEIYVSETDILGQGVHLAARLQTASPINGVAFTEGTYANLDPQYRNLAVSMGQITLKGFPHKQTCYAIEEADLLGHRKGNKSKASCLSLKNIFHNVAVNLNRLQWCLLLLLAVSALTSDLDPASSFNLWLLDHRLLAQRYWRNITHQPGPIKSALPVILLQSDQPLLPRSLLVNVLRQLPPDRFPRVAMDLVLDRQGNDPVAISELVKLIKQQKRDQLIAGYFGSESNAVGAGKARSIPIAPLLQVGVLPRDLTVGTVAGTSRVQPVPIQILLPITDQNLGGSIAAPGTRNMPADSIIDWSLRWERMISIQASEKPRMTQAPLILIGRLSGLEKEGVDLFQTPAAVYDPNPIWGGSAREMPGVLVQAIVGQSISLNHWLTPVSNLLCVLVAALAGILLSPTRTRIYGVPVVVVVLPIWIVLSLQVAIVAQLLFPILLPMTGFIVTTSGRRR